MQQGDTITPALPTAADGVCHRGRTVTHGGCAEPGLCGQGGISWAQSVENYGDLTQPWFLPTSELCANRPQLSSCERGHRLRRSYDEKQIALAVHRAGPSLLLSRPGGAGAPHCEPATAL